MTVVLRVDKANANDINKAFIELVKEPNSDYISHENVKESDIDEYDIDIYRTDSSILAKNLISGIHNYWCFSESKKEINIDGSCLNKIRFYDNLRPESEAISMNSVPDEHQDDIIFGLKNLCVKYSNKIIMGYFNINSIRNKFELLSSLIGGKTDILQSSTITIKSPYVITYLCQNFGVRDVRMQIPRSIYQVSYLLPSDFPNNFS